MDEPPALARCDDHGLVLVEGDSGHMTHCAACQLGLEVRLGDDLPGGRLDEHDFRNRVEWDTLVELVPLMREYLADQTDEFDLWVSHFPREGSLPAGYSDQERFVLGIGYSFGIQRKYLLREPNAAETVETLREEGYTGDVRS